MSVKVIPTTHELAVKQWEEGLEAEVLKKISVMGLIGPRSDSVIQFRDVLTKEPGDNVRIGLRMQDADAPITSGSAVEGSELALTLRYMNVTLDEYAHAYRWGNVIDRQRVTFEMRDESKAALADLLANAFDHSFFNQVAGITGGATTFDGHNAIVAPGAANWLRVGGGAAETNITDTDTITLDDISQAVQIAKTTSPAIRPANLPGYPEPLYVVFLHPWQTYSLREADSRWDVVMKQAMAGGMIGDNPLITGALGVWDGCLICENSRVPKGLPQADSGTTRRAIFMGAQAAMTVFGRIGGTPERFRWVEKLFDYDREMGVLGGFVGGVAKSVFSLENAGGGPLDFATIVISSSTAVLEPD